MPCAMCLVPCDLCLVPCSMFHVPCAMCLVPCALCLVPCAMCLAPCALCHVPCAMCNVINPYARTCATVHTSPLNRPKPYPPPPTHPWRVQWPAVTRAAAARTGLRRRSVSATRASCRPPAQYLAGSAHRTSWCGGGGRGGG